MSYTRIDDHAEQALERLTQSYSDALGVRGMVTVLAGAVQDIEDALDAVRTMRFKQGGVLEGAQLDTLGAVVGQPRQGLGDAVYTVLILGAIARNNSQATVENLLALAGLIYQAGAVFVATPNGGCRAPQTAPAGLQLAVGSPQTDAALYPTLMRALQQAIGAGISIGHVATFEQAGAFAFAGPQAWVRGFADLHGALGGPMADLVYTNQQEVIA